MMNERSKEILNDISKVEGLYESLLAIQRSAQAEGLSREEYAAKFQTAVNEAGIEATKEEIMDFLQVEGKTELSLEELDNVTGGCNTFHSCNKYKSCDDGATPSGRSCYPHC